MYISINGFVLDFSQNHSQYDKGENYMKDPNQRDVCLF